MSKKGIKAITVRGLPPPVERVIRRRSAESGRSLNKVVLDLIEEGAGIRKARQKVLCHDLDRLIGAWSRDEAKSFDRTLENQRKIDPELWK